MKNKFVAAVSALLLAAMFFAGCGGSAALRSGAEITLNLVTTAEKYDVSSSYGTVRFENGKCVIGLDCRKDILVTVSAEGYKTVSVAVKVADMKSGKCERDVFLTEKLGRIVEITVSGVNVGLSGTCGGRAFSVKNNVLYGEFTEEELTAGVTITADGAEPCFYAFGASELYQWKIKASVELIPEGKKYIGTFGSAYYAVDEYGNFLPMESGDLIVDEGFTGVIYVWYRNYDFSGKFYPERYVVDENTPAYQGISVIRSGSDREYTISGVSEEQCKAWSGFGSERIYYERDGSLYEQELEYRSGSAVAEVYGTFEKFWLIDFEKESFRAAVPDKRHEMSLSSFVAQDLEPAYLLIDSYRNNQPLSGTKEVLAEYWDENETKQISLTVTDGVIGKADVGDVNIDGVSFDGGNTWGSVGQAITQYTLIGGKICRNLWFYMPVSYEVDLKNESGEAISGATIRGVQTEEISPGRYRIEENLQYNNFAALTETEKTAYLVYLNIEGKEWTFEEATRTYVGEITLYDRGGFIMTLNFRAEELKIECDDPSFSFHRLAMNYYYVYAPVTAQTQVRLTFTTGFDQTGPVTETIERTLDVGEIMHNGAKIEIHNF